MTSLADKATQTELDITNANSISHSLKKSTVSNLAHVKPDGISIVSDVNGVISAIGTSGGGVITNYNPSTTYAATDIISYGGKMYISQVSSNIGNTPSTSPTKWEEYNNDKATRDLAWDNKLYNGNFALGLAGFINSSTGVTSIVSNKLHVDFGKTNLGGFRLDDATNTLTSKPNKKILFRLKGLNDGVLATNTNLTYMITNAIDSKSQSIQASKLVPNVSIDDLLMFTVPSDWAEGLLRVYIQLTFTTQATDSIGYISLDSWMALDLGVPTDNLYTYNYTKEQLNDGIDTRGYFQDISQGVINSNKSLFSNTANFALDGDFSKSDKAWVNVLQNADGLDSTNYWIPGGASTLSVIDGVFSFLADIPARSVVQAIDIVPNKTVKFEVEVNVLVGATFVLQVAFYQANGTFISQSTPTSYGILGFNRYKTKVVTPLLTAYMKVGIADTRASGWTTLQFRKPIVIIVSDIVNPIDQLIEIEDLGGFWIDNPHFGNMSVRSAQAQAKTRWTNKNWLALGDSVTFRNQYPPVVMAKHRFSSYLNLGVSGQQVGTMSDSVTAGNIADKDLVTLYAPLNNYAGLTTIGTLADAPNKTGTFYAQCKFVINAILTLKPSIKIGFIGSHNVGYNVTGYPTINTANSIGKFLKDYVDAMEIISEFYGIPFLDLYKTSGINEYSISVFSDDNVHPNLLGMTNIGYQIADFINTI